MPKDNVSAQQNSHPPANSVAAIDVGSNAIRLLVANLSEHGSLVDTDYHRYQVRLGVDAFGAEKLSDATIKALVEVFVDIAARLKTNGCTRYRAVATAAMRAAKNRADVVKQIKAKTGLKLEIIDGLEESRLSRQGLVRAVGDLPKETLIIDLGGGSLEVERLTGKGRVSLPLGGLRMLEEFPGLAGITDAATVDKALNHARVVLKKAMTRWPSPEFAIGTGGLRAYADLAPWPKALMPTIDLDKLPNLIRQAMELSPQQRAKAFSLRDDRAELLLSGAVVLTALAQASGLKQLAVPGSGLRESITYELAEPPSVWPQLMAARKRLALKTQPAEDRRRLALALFDRLAGIHRLWGPAKVPLELLCALWDAGAAIDPKRAREHAGYLVCHIEPLQVTASQRQLAADIATWPTQDAAPEDLVRRRLRPIIHLAAFLAEHGVRSLDDAKVTDLHVKLNVDVPPARRLCDDVSEALGVRVRM